MYFFLVSKILRNFFNFYRNSVSLHNKFFYGLQTAFRLPSVRRPAGRYRPIVQRFTRRCAGCYAAGRNRFRQNLYHGERHSAASASGPDSEPQQNPRSPAFKAVLPEGPDYFVQGDNLGENGAPILITQNEFMRRYREMSALGGGMNFYGSMPDSYNLTVNMRPNSAVNKGLYQMETREEEQQRHYQQGAYPHLQGREGDVQKRLD